VTQAAGKINNSAQFTNANSESLSIGDNASLSTGNIDFTIAGWFMLDNKGANKGLAGKNVGGNFADFEWDLRYQASSDRLTFQVGNGVASTAVATANNLGSPSTATWYYVVAWHDSVADTVNIQVNDGTVDSTAYSAGSWDSGHPFKIGATSIFFGDGRIDEVGFWKRVLTSGERTSLYNSGSGLAYPF
jgi:hypothetical protein